MSKKKKAKKKAKKTTKAAVENKEPDVISRALSEFLSRGDSAPKTPEEKREARRVEESEKTWLPDDRPEPTDHARIAVLEARLAVLEGNLKKACLMLATGYSGGQKFRPLAGQKWDKKKKVWTD